VDWPNAPIESVPHDRFTPSFCPRPDCPQHRVEPHTFRYRRLRATCQRRCDGRVVPRSLCRACRRGFSQQSFAASYYLKRPELTVPIARASSTEPAHRRIARVAGCAPRSDNLGTTMDVGPEQNKKARAGAFAPARAEDLTVCPT